MKPRKKYVVHVPGGVTKYTSWADAAHFIKYLLDNNSPVTGISVVEE